MAVKLLNGTSTEKQTNKPETLLPLLFKPYTMTKYFQRILVMEKGRGLNLQITEDETK